jgi:regulatory protein
MPLDSETTSSEAAQKLLEKCRESALRLLDSRMHSHAELDRKLRQREFPRVLREVILTDLERVGLVDDRMFAEAFVREKLTSSRPVGARRILLDLRRRGIADELAREALAEAAEEEDGDAELNRAKQAAERKWASLMRSKREFQKARASLYRFLASRGFDSDTIRRVVDDLPRPPDAP